MRIAIDVDSRNVLTWAGVAIEALDATCRDRFPVNVKFISNGRYVELPSDAVGTLSLKVPGAWAGNVIASGGAWVKTGAEKTAVYSFFLRLDTVELAALFAAEPDSVALAIEIEWSYGSPMVRSTSRPLPVTVANDYIRETDGLPVLALDLKATQTEAEDGVANDKWMTPLRVAQVISKMAGAIGVSWSLITGKPTVFPPEAHDHLSADVTDLSATIDAKIAVVDAGDY